jgi:hypothetical protein
MLTYAMTLPWQRSDIDTTRLLTPEICRHYLRHTAPVIKKSIHCRWRYLFRLFSPSSHVVSAMSDIEGFQIISRETAAPHASALHRRCATFVTRRRQPSRFLHCLLRVPPSLYTTLPSVTS